MFSDTTLRPRFLVVSLGNPPPHAQSKHSAGHITLSAARQLLGSTQPEFKAHRLNKKSTQASFGEKYIFLQSPTQMNVTGHWLAKAYKQILAQEGLDQSELGLVIVHDSLEHSIGDVKVLSWEKSHQGHNGVRSINASLQRQSAEAPWVRIAVGIGRPVQRDYQTVSDYVLRPFSKHQKEVIQENAEEVLDALQELEEEWDIRDDRLGVEGVHGVFHPCEMSKT